MLQTRWILRWNQKHRRWEATGPYESRHIPKNAGFFWDPQSRCWATDIPQRAWTLVRFADHATRKHLVTLKSIAPSSRFPKAPSTTQIDKLLHQDHELVRPSPSVLIPAIPAILPVRTDLPGLDAITQKYAKQIEDGHALAKHIEEGQ